MPTRPADPVLKADRTESAAEWLILHKQRVVIGLVALAILFAGAWFYRRSTQIKSARAEQAYFEARQAMVSGNSPLAMSDLRAVTTRYPGTTGSVQAALAIAQIQYDQGNYREGMAELKKAQTAGAGDLAHAVHVLLAVGHEGLKQFDAAAAEYQRAAEVTRFPNDAAAYRASAARALMAGGKNDAARAIWADLADDPQGPLVSEAKVRLGELAAKPAT